MFPKGRHLDPKPGSVEGPKSATEQRYDGGANVAVAIRCFPALNYTFVGMIPSIFPGNPRHCQTDLSIQAYCSRPHTLVGVVGFYH